jgi:hypothetical protein
VLADAIGDELPVCPPPNHQLFFLKQLFKFGYALLCIPFCIPHFKNILKRNG